MESSLECISNYWEKMLKSKQKLLNNFINDYKLYFITKQSDIEKKYQNIIQMFTISKAIIINSFDIVQNECIFVIGFEKSVIIVKQDTIKLLENLFFENQYIPIYHLSNSKEHFNKNISILNPQNECTFLDEINALSQCFQCNVNHVKALKNILPCITGYWIAKNLVEIEPNDFDCQNKIWTKDDFIVLKSLGMGSSFNAEQIFHIESQKLFVLKNPNSCSEIQKLIKRESRNYESINHRFIPKKIAQLKDDKSLIIQYINGTTLTEYDISSLKFNSKITIIFELMIVIKYLHRNKFVYRDLKPNNIMIDKNGNIFLIDFDRMVEYSKKSEINDYTKDLSSIFQAPEVQFGTISYANDIYSLGQMIFYIMNDSELPTDENVDKANNFWGNSDLRDLYKKCTDEKITKRPEINELMYKYGELFYKNINKLLFQNDPDAHFLMGAFYYEGEIIKKDVNKAIKCFEFASENNIPEAQSILGLLYYQGLYLKQNINAAYDLLSKAANQNCARAQYNLGVCYLKDNYNILNKSKANYYFELASDHNISDILCYLGFIYLNGKYVKQNINKAIDCFSRAADQNDVKAQFELGLIYYDGIIIERDIEKAIYYFSLAADQNDSQAIFNLGIIYFHGKYTARNIDKGIKYFLLSAENNNPYAQYNLGVLYNSNKYVKRDINKAIHYFELAANQNHLESQMNLAYIYLYDDVVLHDIDKVIFYYKLAANQNFFPAQMNLGVIYFEGKYIKQDVNKSIYYLSLAARHNNEMACYAQVNLANIYYFGQYVQKDIKKAIYYYTLAANNKMAVAQYNLGIYYSDEKYTIPDISKAIHYFKLAANQNFEPAQLALGKIYFDHKYIKTDIKRAIQYFELAANQNNSKALFFLGYIYHSGKYVKQDINKAIHFYLLSSKRDNADALLQLGNIYFLGYNNMPNIEKALNFYLRAANQNNAFAQFYVGIWHLYIKQDIKKAIYYLVCAANQKIHEANYLLGVIYHVGKYIIPNIEKAVHYYKIASSFNNQFAKNNLGIIFKNKSFGYEIDKNGRFFFPHFCTKMLSKCKHFKKFHFLHQKVFNFFKS